MIKFTCRKCRRTHELPDSLADVIYQCPKCKTKAPVSDPADLKWEGFLYIRVASAFATGALLIAMSEDVPHVYFDFLRIYITIIACVVAYHLFRDIQSRGFVIVPFTIAVLFNPLVPIGFEHEVWQAMIFLVPL